MILKSLARESNAVWWHTVWSRLGPFLRSVCFYLFRMICFGFLPLFLLACWFNIKALEDCQCRCTFQDLFEKAVWRLEDIRSKYMPMMETCHEYGLLAALTLVPFHVFVGARSFHVFQKRCSREAVGFFVVPVSYLFRCFVLRGLAWLVKMPIIASVPKCVFHPASSIPRDQQRNVFREIQVTKWYVPPFVFLLFPCQISGSNHSDEFLSEQCSFRGGGMGWTCPG